MTDIVGNDHRNDNGANVGQQSSFSVSYTYKREVVPECDFKEVFCFFVRQKITRQIGLRAVFLSGCFLFESPNSSLKLIEIPVTLVAVVLPGVFRVEGIIYKLFPEYFVPF